jgi:hypothetical protein
MAIYIVNPIGVQALVERLRAGKRITAEHVIDQSEYVSISSIIQLTRTSGQQSPRCRYCANGISTVFEMSHIYPENCPSLPF